MQPDADALADTVVLLIKAALAPLQAELAALREKVAVIDAHGGALSTLRDRVVAAETKAAIPAAPDASLGELRDRLLVLETKAAIPPVPVLPLPPEAGFDDLRDRIVNLEARSAGPSVTDMSLVDVRERIARLEARTADDAFSKEMGILRERVAVVEVRAQVPGPAGKDGADGKNGVDGLGFDDLSVDFDGDRTLALKFERGSLKKSFPITLPFMRQQGVYTEGKQYVLGDVVTWGGSQWHCNEETSTKPGEGAKSWTLVVKRGRDGKDGRDGHDAGLPVVKAGAY